MTRLLLLTVVLMSFASNLSHAAVMSRDWLEPGDGLLTYEDVNQREWLDVPETLLSKWGSYENVIAETEPGGAFAGFVPAISDDVFALAESAGIDTSTQSLAANESVVRELIQLLGPTSPSIGTSAVFSWGQIDEIDPSNNLRVHANFVVSPNGAGLNLFSRISLDPPLIFTTRGVLLYRGVPEPSTYLLTTLALAFLITVSRRSAPANIY